MKQNSERSKSSPGAQSHSGGRSPLARQAAARVLQAAANRRAFNAQILAQQTPAASAAQELGITPPTVTTADARRIVSDKDALMIFGQKRSQSCSIDQPVVGITRSDGPDCPFAVAYRLPVIL